jgi:hypothetical protein
LLARFFSNVNILRFNGFQRHKKNIFKQRRNQNNENTNSESIKIRAQSIFSDMGVLLTAIVVYTTHSNYMTKNLLKDSKKLREMAKVSFRLNIMTHQKKKLTHFATKSSEIIFISRRAGFTLQNCFIVRKKTIKTNTKKNHFF